MANAALITWLCTAAGGAYLLGVWIAHGGERQPRTSRLPPVMVFGHFGLTAAGLPVWILYLVTKSMTLAWVAVLVLVPVPVMALVMLLRWIPTYRARRATPADAPGEGTTEQMPAEGHFPVAIVVEHGALAVTTVVLVLLTALGLGAH